MKQVAAIFKRELPQLWYVLGMSMFFLLFSMAYAPKWMYNYLQMPKASFFFNTTMIFCILFVCLSIFRFIIYRYAKKYICANYIVYSGWCLMEIFLSAWFIALYCSLMAHEMYFSSLGKALGIVLSTLAYPCVIITLAYVIVGFKEKPVEDSQMVRFRDVNHKLKFTIDFNSILYIAAEENYLRIYYVDGDEVKNYQLRASMNSIAKTATEAGLFRCQRSYYINPSHIKAIRKDKQYNISADLDCGDTSVKVSKKVYNELSDLI